MREEARAPGGCHLWAREPGAAATEDALEVFELAGGVGGSVCEKASLGAVRRERWRGTGWCQEKQVRDLSSRQDSECTKAWIR